MSFEIVAEGLGFPEGPIAMHDGSVIVIEIKRGTVSRCWNGKTEVIATLGGGPNGAANFGSTGYNGIGLSPDEKTVYTAETFTGRLVAFDITGPGQIARRGGRFPGRVVAAMRGIRWNTSIVSQ
jgi:sugar lactone lactonase YvrE